MFRNLFGTHNDAATQQAAQQAEASLNAAADAAATAGETATVRRIVSKLEAMPPEQARLIASAAYTLAARRTPTWTSATSRPPRSSPPSRPARPSMSRPRSS